MIHPDNLFGPRGRVGFVVAQSLVGAVDPLAGKFKIEAVFYDEVAFVEETLYLSVGQFSIFAHNNKECTRDCELVKVTRLRSRV